MKRSRMSPRRGPTPSLPYTSLSIKLLVLMDSPRTGGVGNRFIREGKDQGLEDVR